MSCKNGFRLPSNPVTQATCVDPITWDNTFTSCVDIDECAEDLHNCDDTQECTNLPGTYDCSCPDGYHHPFGDPVTCVDIDECYDDSLNLCNQLCQNTQGSYTCSCNEGYSLFEVDGTNGFYLAAGEDGLDARSSFVYDRTCVPVMCTLDVTFQYAIAVFASGCGCQFGNSSVRVPYNYYFEVVTSVGYMVSGEYKLTCTAEGTFNFDIPSIIVTSCQAPEDIEHGSWVASDPSYYGYLSTATYTCKDGYVLVGPATTVCQQFNYFKYGWTGPTPECKRVPCGDPEIPDNSRCYYEDVRVGDKVICRCNPGFALVGEAERVCQDDGSWSGSVPYCTLLTCEDPGTPDDGKQYGMYGRYYVGSLLHFYCDQDGYGPQPDEPIMCTVDGFRQPETPGHRDRRSVVSLQSTTSLRRSRRQAVPEVSQEVFDVLSEVSKCLGGTSAAAISLPTVYSADYNNLVTHPDPGVREVRAFVDTLAQDAQGALRDNEKTCLSAIDVEAMMAVPTEPVITLTPENHKLVTDIAVCTGGAGATALLLPSVYTDELQQLQEGTIDGRTFLDTLIADDEDQFNSTIKGCLSNIQIMVVERHVNFIVMDARIRQCFGCALPSTLTAVYSGYETLQSHEAALVSGSLTVAAVIDSLFVGLDNRVKTCLDGIDVVVQETEVQKIDYTSLDRSIRNCITTENLQSLSAAYMGTSTLKCYADVLMQEGSSVFTVLSTVDTTLTMNSCLRSIEVTFEDHSGGDPNGHGMDIEWRIDFIALDMAARNCYDDATWALTSAVYSGPEDLHQFADVLKDGSQTIATIAASFGLPVNECIKEVTVTYVDAIDYTKLYNDTRHCLRTTQNAGFSLANLKQLESEIQAENFCVCQLPSLLGIAVPSQDAQDCLNTVEVKYISYEEYMSRGNNTVREQHVNFIVMDARIRQCFGCALPSSLTAVYSGYETLQSYEAALINGSLTVAAVINILSVGLNNQVKTCLDGIDVVVQESEVQKIDYASLDQSIEDCITTENLQSLSTAYMGISTLKCYADVLMQEGSSVFTVLSTVDTTLTTSSCLSSIEVTFEGHSGGDPGNGENGEPGDGQGMDIEWRIDFIALDLSIRNCYDDAAWALISAVYSGPEDLHQFADVLKDGSQTIADIAGAYGFPVNDCLREVTITYIDIIDYVALYVDTKRCLHGPVNAEFSRMLRGPGDLKQYESTISAENFCPCQLPSLLGLEVPSEAQDCLDMVELKYTSYEEYMNRGNEGVRVDVPMGVTADSWELIKGCFDTDVPSWLSFYLAAGYSYSTLISSLDSGVIPVEITITITDPTDIYVSLGITVENFNCLNTTTVEEVVVGQPYWNGSIPVCVDMEPPVISCPQVEVIKTQDRNVSVNLQTYLNSVQATDNVGVVRIEYAEETFVIPTYSYIYVKVSAYDAAGNVGECWFGVIVTLDGCPQWSLMIPPDGEMNCGSPIGGGFVCNVGCPGGQEFVQPLPELTPGSAGYVCSATQGWIPNNYVPGCSPYEIPDCSVVLAANYSAECEPGDDCMNTYYQLIDEIITDANLLSECSDEIVENIKLDYEVKIFKVHRERESGSGSGSDTGSNPSNTGSQNTGSTSSESNEDRKKATESVSSPSSNGKKCREHGNDSNSGSGGNRKTDSRHRPENNSGQVCGYYAMGRKKDPSSSTNSNSEDDDCECYCDAASGSKKKNSNNCSGSGSRKKATESEDCEPEPECICPSHDNRYIVLLEFTVVVTGNRSLLDCSEYKSCRDSVGDKVLEWEGKDAIFPEDSSRWEDCPDVIQDDKFIKINSSCHCPKGYAMKDCSCLKCTPGTYEEDGVCVSCPVGYYQDEHGQTACKDCPDDHSTRHEGVKHGDRCVPMCPPGHFSTDGLFPCNLCPANYYASGRGNMECSPCDEGQFSHPGSNECGAYCPLGHHSKTGLEPCRPCGYGFYQDETGKRRCKPCEEGKRTLDKGSTSPDDCVDSCSEDPCLNGGTCQPGSCPHTYKCECPPQYHGPHCEESYSCASEPCMNNATCVDTEDSYYCDCPPGFCGDQCEIPHDPCRRFPCLNNGTCLLRENEDGFICLCPPDFRGDRCEEKIDDCSSEPCQNDGVCVDSVRDVICFCPPDYTGKYCETLIDNCASEPCENGGTCMDGVNRYTCQCPQGFSGRHCQIDEDDCTGVVCENGGTCVDGDNSYECLCEDGYTGVHCELVDTDPCDPNECKNGGTCTPKDPPGPCSCQKFMCTCPVGFTGYFCEIDMDDCVSDPCQNGATCVDKVNGYECSCPHGFTGTHCEDLQDYCLSEPCQNDGICNTVIDGFDCSCLPGWTGPLCEEDIDDCASEPCKNGATCVDRRNSFTCTCAPGFTGPTCEEDVNECDDYPCKNAATCHNNYGSYECECLDGYTGKHCEEDIDECESEPCENGGTCMDEVNGFHCECTPVYRGPTCNKKKGPNFDLYFCAERSSNAQSPAQSFGATAYTFMLWIRYACSDSGGTPFQVIESDDQVFNTFTVTHELPSGQPFDGIQDTQWHHLALTWDSQTGSQTWYIDGESVLSRSNVRTGETTAQWLKVILGRPYESSEDSEAFHGEISQFNMYSRVFSANEIQNVFSSGCGSFEEKGDIVEWVFCQYYRIGCTRIIRPSICGGSVCPPESFYKGCPCGDKEPPVLTCPEDVRIINPDSRLTNVDYGELDYEDNVGVVDVSCSIENGSPLAWGVYSVTCVAYDASENSATCSFKIYVTPFDCEDPVPPIEGSKTCDTWQYGIFCTIGCKVGKVFTVLPAPYYTCGHEGVWDPNAPDEPFVFPGCAGADPARGRCDGSIDYSVVDCDENDPTGQREPNSLLREAFIEKIEYLNSIFGICGGDCDFSSLRIECDTPSGTSSPDDRRRRQAETQTAALDFSFGTSTSANNGQSIDEVLEDAAFNGNLSSPGFTADPQSIATFTTISCPDGKILNGVNCVNCPLGEFHNTTEDKCMKCPKGEYQDEEAQVTCKSCGDHKTTEGTGAVSYSMCVVSCDVGSYNRGGRCEPCPIGGYQDESGKFACKGCPTFTSTANAGSSKLGDCQLMCLDAGKQLGVSGECQPCPVGTYSVDGESNCQRCPFGFSTSITGAINVTDCTVVECNIGSYKDEASGMCKPCPLGEYQSRIGKTYCKRCPAMTTTLTEGSIKSAQCIECQEDSPSCNEDLCIDHCMHDGVCSFNNRGLPECECADGYSGDRCQISDSACDNYCYNDGICQMDESGSRSCTCVGPYVGDQCETHKDAYDGLSLSQKRNIAAIVGGVLGAVIVLMAIAYLLTVRHLKKNRTPAYPSEPPPDYKSGMVFDNVVYGDAIPEKNSAGPADPTPDNVNYHYNTAYQADDQEPSTSSTPTRQGTPPRRGDVSVDVTRPGGVRFDAEIQQI
ncbi:uncharacterized protein [Ptychodera flava]|uniref:uncharacterized protein n=1 Tax=Ptychodera flava TaxID=63121 RepID=UPI00396A431D